MTTPQDANSLLMGGNKCVSFDGNPPITWSGTILSWREEQAKDFHTKELKTWPDGNPLMQAIYSLQTDARDPENPEDDGVRDMYVDSTRKRRALADAVKAAGASRPEAGGRFTLTWTGMDHTSRAPNPPKVYSAQYEKPNPLAQSGPPAGQQDPWAVAPPTGTPPQATPAAATATPAPAATPAVDPNLLAEIAARMPGQDLSKLTPENATLIAKSLGINA